MDIAIVGAGVAGSSLYHLIKRQQNDSGIRVDLYSKPEHHSCRIHPCGWMTHVPDFYQLMDTFGLSGDRYLLQQFPHMNFDGSLIRCGLATIHKPRLILDLRGAAAILDGPVDIDAYDVVVDCTGAARALLPAAKEDLISSTLQYRVRRDGLSIDELHPAIKFVNIGYAWSFPLDRIHLHVGIGSLTENLPDALSRTGLLQPGDDVLCHCRSGVRIGAPHRTLPLHQNNVWGVGESIGTVSPLVGDGIVPSMECASLFVEHLLKETLDKYPEQVLTKFAWMEEERKVIDRMIAHGGKIGVKDLLVMRNHAYRFGLHLGPSWILSWIAGKRQEEFA
jgi:flavin-dependent dehydrogenase